MSFNLRCLFGSHVWGEWEYEAPGRCTQVKICRRDGTRAKNTQIQHDWGEWEPGNSCKQTRLCHRDNKEESRTQHEWGSWEYVSEGLCDLKRTCLKCKDTETEKKHAFQEISSKSWSEVIEEKISGQSYEGNTRDVTITYTTVIEECVRCHHKKTTNSENKTIA